MSTLDLSELHNRLQLLRKQEKHGTDEEFHHAVKRFNDLSAFLQQVIGKELQQPLNQRKERKNDEF
jgi:hypothetical protein